MVAAAIVGSSVVGAAVSLDASRRASKTQADAANKASDLSQQQFEQNREDMAPWRAAGAGALSQLTAGTGAGGDFNRNFTLADFQQDPGYAFRQQQGMRGVESSAAARGGLLNGGTLKALDRYNQDYASGEFQNAYNRFNNDRTQRFNRLASIAGLGQTATRDVANMGTQNAQQIGNNVMQAANARASGYIGQANAVNGGIQSLGNWWQQANALGGGGTSYVAPNANGTYNNPGGGGYSFNSTGGSFHDPIYDGIGG